MAYLDDDLAANHHRQLVLADLISLGEIGVEVVLARENRFRRHLPVNRQAEPNRTIYSTFIEYRQHPGQGEIHCVRLHVRLGAKSRRTPGKYLRFRQQLYVRLDADDDFPLFHYLSLTRHAQRPLRVSTRIGQR